MHLITKGFFSLKISYQESNSNFYTLKYMNGLFIYYFYSLIPNTMRTRKFLKKKIIFQNYSFILRICSYQAHLQCISEIEHAESRFFWKIFITNKCFSLLGKKYSIG